jgi:hypothetical protein
LFVLLSPVNASTQKFDFKMNLVELDAQGNECATGSACAGHEIGGDFAHAYNFVTNEPALSKDAQGNTLTVGGVAVEDNQLTECVPGSAQFCSKLLYTLHAVRTERTVVAGSSSFVVPAGSFMGELVILNWGLASASTGVRVRLSLLGMAAANDGVGGSPVHNVPAEASKGQRFLYRTQSSLAAMLGVFPTTLVNDTERPLLAPVSFQPTVPVVDFNVDLDVRAVSEYTKVYFYFQPLDSPRPASPPDPPTNEADESSLAVSGIDSVPGGIITVVVVVAAAVLCVLAICCFFIMRSKKKKRDSH